VSRIIFPLLFVQCAAMILISRGAAEGKANSLTQRTRKEQKATEDNNGTPLSLAPRYFEWVVRAGSATRRTCWWLSYTRVAGAPDDSG